MRWWGALMCLDLVAKPSPAPEARAGPAVWPGRDRSAPTGGVRPLPPPPRGLEPGRAPLRGAASYEAEG